MRIDITTDEQLADLSGTVAAALAETPDAELVLSLHPSLQATAGELSIGEAAGARARRLVIEGAAAGGVTFAGGTLSVIADEIVVRNIVFRGSRTNHPVLALTATRAVSIERVAIVDAVRLPTWDPTSQRSGPSAAAPLIQCDGPGASCTLRDVWVSGTTSERATTSPLLGRGDAPGPLHVVGLGLVSNEASLRVALPADAVEGLACDHRPGGFAPGGLACPTPDWSRGPDGLDAESTALRARAERAAPVPDAASLAEGLAPSARDRRGGKHAPGQEPPPGITRLEQWPPHDPAVPVQAFRLSIQSGRHRHGHDTLSATGRFDDDGLHLEVESTQERGDGPTTRRWSGVVTDEEAATWTRALRSPPLSDRARGRGGSRRTLRVDTPLGRHACTLRGGGGLGALLLAAVAQGEVVVPE